MAAGSIIIDMALNTGSVETDSKRAEASLNKIMKAFGALRGEAVQIATVYDNVGKATKQVVVGNDSLTNSVKTVELNYQSLRAEMDRVTTQQKIMANEAANLARLRAARENELSAALQQRMAEESRRNAAQQAFLSRQASEYASRQAALNSQMNSGAVVLNNNLQKSQAGFRGMNQVIQNTSYQVTDFVVQVSGGVSAMRAFSQQAPQFLGAFGGIGAILGVFAALGGAVADLVIKSQGTKTFSDSLNVVNDALGGVASTARTFDMTPVIKQFNAADAATRESIVQLMSYRKALIEVTNIDLKKAFSGQVADLTDTGFIGQFRSDMPSETFASKMGIAVNKEMYADLRVLRYEYGSVQEFADKYASTLVRGNEEGRKFAKTIIEMANSLKEGEMATKAIDAAQTKMRSAGAAGTIPVPGGAAAKPDNSIQKLYELQANSVDKFIDSLQRQTDQLAFNKNLIGMTTQEVELLNAQYKIQAELEKTIQDLERQSGTIRAEELEKMKSAAAEAIAAQTSIITASQERQRSSAFGMESAIRSYTENAGNMAKNMEGAFTNAFKGMEDGIVKFALTGKASFGDFANAVISDIMRIYVRMAIAGLVGKAVGAFGNPQSFQTQSDLNMFGTTDLGYADGGYTGDGGKYQPAGIVHAGEFVMTKEATSRIGVGNLYSMMRGYANGGYVGSSMPTGSGGGININIKNEAGGDGYQATATARKNDTGFDIDILVRKALTNDIRNNGPMSQTMSSTFGLRRTA